MSNSNASVNTSKEVATPKKAEVLEVKAEEIPRPDVSQAILKLDKAGRIRIIRDEFKKKIDEYESFGQLLEQGVGFRVLFQTFNSDEIEFTNTHACQDFFKHQMERAYTHLARIDADLIAALS